MDRDGACVGKIGQIFYDDRTDAPKWVTVRSGLFGTRENFVPLRGARLSEGDLQVPYAKSVIKSAPGFQVEAHISMKQEDLVYEHYGLEPEAPGQRAAEPIWRPKGKHARRPDVPAQEERYRDSRGGDAA
nr:PRC-barrel domain containing protein [Nocardiopsis mwathae]